MSKNGHRVQELVKLLLTIARKYPGYLPKNVRKQVESIMYELKWIFKYTDIEISRMSGGRWSKDTVRQYASRRNAEESIAQAAPAETTATLRPEAPKPRDEEGIAGDKIRRYVEEGITIEQIKKYNELEEKLQEEYDIGIEQIAEAISDCNKGGIQWVEMVQDQLWLKEEDINQLHLTEAVKFLRRLTERRIDMDFIEELYNLPTKFRKSKLVQAIIEADKLENLRDANIKAAIENETLSREISAKKTEFEAIQNAINVAKPGLVKVKTLERKGMTEGKLGKLGDAVNKYGGFDKAMDGFAEYTGITEIQSRRKQLEDDYKSAGLEHQKQANDARETMEVEHRKWEEKIDRLKAEHAELQDVGLNHLILVRSGYRSEQVNRVVDLLGTITKRLGGKPEDLLEALGTYRDSKALQEEYTKLKRNNDELYVLQTLLEGKIRKWVDDPDLEYDSRMTFALTVLELYSMRMTPSQNDSEYLFKILGTSNRIFENNNLNPPIEIEGYACPHCNHLLTMKTPVQVLVDRVIKAISYIFPSIDQGRYQTGVPPSPPSWPGDL